MGAKLFIGNLSHSTTEPDLHQVCSEEGREVKAVQVVTERATGITRGFAFVEFTTEAAAQQALTALHGRELQGRVITAVVAKEKVLAPVVHDFR